jgi:hypothetical protein
VLPAREISFQLVPVRTLVERRTETILGRPSTSATHHSAWSLSVHWWAPRLVLCLPALAVKHRSAGGSVGAAPAAGAVSTANPVAAIAEIVGASSFIMRATLGPTKRRVAHGMCRG